MRADLPLGLSAHAPLAYRSPVANGRITICGSKASMTRNTAFSLNPSNCVREY